MEEKEYLAGYDVTDVPVVERNAYVKSRHEEEYNARQGGYKSNSRDDVSKALRHNKRREKAKAANKARRISRRKSK